MNKYIETCATSQLGSKLVVPKDLSSLTDWQDMIHVTFTSSIFGFIDDMYMQSYFNATAEKSVLNIMSELRIGQSDFGRNENNVNKILKCMAQYVQESEFIPCSDWDYVYNTTDDDNSTDNSSTDESASLFLQYMDEITYI